MNRTLRTKLSFNKRIFTNTQYDFVCACFVDFLAQPMHDGWPFRVLCIFVAEDDDDEGKKESQVRKERYICTNNSLLILPFAI